MDQLEKTTSIRLLRAADILKREGWCQEQTMDAHGRRCLLGAMGAALLDEGIDPMNCNVWNPDMQEMKKRVVEVLPVRARDWFAGSDPFGCGITNYNDKICRSSDEAIRILERAAGVSDQIP